MKKIKDIKELNPDIDLSKAEEKAKGFLTEFKEFAMKGNVVDLAIGMIIGSAFTSIVNSLVKDVITPLIGAITGGLDFSNLFVSLDGTKYATLAEEQEDKIVFLDSKSHAELPEIYASADLFVGPSVTAKDGAKEGLGLVFLEAMASGIPVIGSNSGGIPEIIKDGVNGFLVEERDSINLAKRINEILKSEELCNQFIENGLKTAAERDYKNIAQKYAEIILS